MRRSLVPAYAASALILAGCGGEGTEAQSEKPDAASGPALQAEVVHTYFNDDPLGRFTFEFTNPADETRIGATVTWKALDKDGVIVGSFDKKLPPISSGGTWHYVGGAGGANLTGVPAQAKVEVTDQGDLEDGEFESLISVEKAEFKRSDFTFYDNAQTYDVTAVLAASDEVATAEIDSAVLLLDKSGKVVGGDWLDFSSGPEKTSRPARS